MKHTILRKVGSALLITGLSFVLPAYAQTHGGTGETDMHEKGTTDMQPMSAMMHDMSGEMMEMSSIMDKGNMNPGAMKKISNQMKEMGSMMENMSAMMDKGTMMDADQHKQMEQMHKHMEQMRKDMPAANNGS
jgi:hypothetical protein